MPGHGYVPRQAGTQPIFLPDTLIPIPPPRHVGKCRLQLPRKGMECLACRQVFTSVSGEKTKLAPAVDSPSPLKQSSSRHRASTAGSGLMTMAAAPTLARAQVQKITCRRVPPPSLWVMTTAQLHRHHPPSRRAFGSITTLPRRRLLAPGRTCTLYAPIRHGAATSGGASEHTRRTYYTCLHHVPNLASLYLTRSSRPSLVSPGPGQKISIHPVSPPPRSLPCFLTSQSVPRSAPSARIGYQGLRPGLCVSQPDHARWSRKLFSYISTFSARKTRPVGSAPTPYDDFLSSRSGHGTDRPASHLEVALQALSRARCRFLASLGRTDALRRRCRIHHGHRFP